MSENVLLSVIVPVFDCARYLIDCIESIIHQTYGDIELILVDDGSTDGSGQICDGYSLKDPRIKVIHKKNEGACYARRDGILAAKGAYVAFVDGDDWIDPDMYQVLMGLLLQMGADIVTSGFTRDESGETSFDLIPEALYEDGDKERLCSVMLYDKQYASGAVMMSVCNKIYRKSLLIPYMMDLPSDIHLWEDITYVYPPFIDAHRVLVTHKSFYHYRNNEGSTSKKFDSLEYEKTIYTLSIARKVYQRFGRDVQEAFDLENSLILYRYLWRCAGNRDKRYGTRKEIERKFRSISQNADFRLPVGAVLDQIPSGQEKEFLGFLLEGEYKKAIAYCRHTLRRDMIRRYVYDLLGEDKVHKIKKSLGRE